MKYCSIENCNKKHHGRGYCRYHYQKLYNHPLTGLHKAMKSRCTNKNAINYPHYGGKGIKVCERWQSFANFLEDMGERPEGMTLERIDSNGDYELSNCKWATRSEQSINQVIRKDNNTGVKGVYWYPRYKKWAAVISTNNKRKLLGYFLNKEDAIQARLEAELNR